LLLKFYSYDQIVKKSKLTQIPALNADSPGAAHYHASPSGHDSNDGSRSSPFKTISAAARVAHPGDAIIVHEGIYRERVNPPRGGTSDDRRITYLAAPGERVVIKGSEIVKGWERLQNDTWKLSLPNSFFGDHNPYGIAVGGDWFRPLGERGGYHTGEVYLNGHWLKETGIRKSVLEPAGEDPLWFARVDSYCTTILAQFKGVDPNQETVEINVRKAVFYPEKAGMDYITVRGFTMEHAATNWAPPTAEQVGLIGTHWSKGWIIEDNTIRYSNCSGISLGKYGDAWDNRAESAEGYVGTIKRALANGWSKARIGAHIVRNNHVSHCEQAGIVGSMGAIFSTVTGNTIHEINRRGVFGGEEMAGIKFHGAIDTIISHNHLYDCGGKGGIWLDWMTQGTRVTGNLLHDNELWDLFLEVNHGPFLVDHNLFLSRQSIRDWSQGSAYAHNLIAGKLISKQDERETPYFKPHSVEDMRLCRIKHKDARFYNNLLLGPSRLQKGGRAKNFQAAGNVSLEGTKIALEEKGDGLWIRVPGSSANKDCAMVTTEMLGRAEIPDAAFVNPDNSPYRLDTDYLGNKRTTANPKPGPFATQDGKDANLKVWPKF
jgi:alpha-N-arabinofuranosidase